MLKENNYLVFDVESDGLYGRPFAWGAVVIDDKGIIYNENLACCDIDISSVWVRDNVLPSLKKYDKFRAENYIEWLNSFWDFWMCWGEPLTLVADCPFPVETNFLTKLIMMHPEQREKLSPYPLIDVASIRFAKGLNPVGEEERLMEEMPKHDPLADAKQSARLLIEALNLKG